MKVEVVRGIFRFSDGPNQTGGRPFLAPSRPRVTRSPSPGDKPVLTFGAETQLKVALRTGDKHNISAFAETADLIVFVSRHWESAKDSRVLLVRCTNEPHEACFSYVATSLTGAPLTSAASGSDPVADSLNMKMGAVVKNFIRLPSPPEVLVEVVVVKGLGNPRSITSWSDVYRHFAPNLVHQAARRLWQCSKTFQSQDMVSLVTKCGQSTKIHRLFLRAAESSVLRSLAE